MLSTKIIKIIKLYENTFEEISKNTYRTKPHFLGDQWFYVDKRDGNWVLIQYDERNQPKERYLGNEDEVLLYLLAVIVNSKNTSKIIDEKYDFKERNGYGISDSQMTYARLLDFMNKIGIDKECYSTENNLIKNTFMIIMNGDTGTFYSVVGNEREVEERAQITKEDKSAFNSFLVTAHHKTVLKRLKESLAREGINLSDYPSEISEVISPRSTFYRD